MSSADFTRQSFLGDNSERVLADTRVAIVGLGGGGSHIAQQLAHLGVGHFRIIDPQSIEASNLNRVVGATHQDVEERTLKVAIAERLIKGVRPWTNVQTSPTIWQDVIPMIADAHVVFGCLDGYRQRDYLESATRHFAIPYIDIGMDVTEFSPRKFAISGQMIMTRPGKPCMRCLGFLSPATLSAEENRYGDAGINPQVVWTNAMLASLAVGAFVKLVTPWADFSDHYTWIEVDGNKQSATASRRPEYISVPLDCPHHGGVDGLGDPLFSLSTQ